MGFSNYIIRNATFYDVEGIANVCVKSWQTSYTGIIDQDFLDSISLEKRLAFRNEILQSKRGLHLIALLDDQIIGFVDVGLFRPDPCLNPSLLLKDKETSIGEIYAIYLLEEHKRKGIGKVFFQRCRQWFSQQGLDSFVAWVLADNLHARRFYESEGGKVIGEKDRQIGEKNYKEVCYLFSLIL